MYREINYRKGLEEARTFRKFKKIAWHWELISEMFHTNFCKKLKVWIKKSKASAAKLQKLVPRKRKNWKRKNVSKITKSLKFYEILEFVCADLQILKICNIRYFTVLILSNDQHKKTNLPLKNFCSLLSIDKYNFGQVYAPTPSKILKNSTCFIW